MGVTRVIVFRNKSFGAHDYRNKSFEGRRRSIAGDKKRWSSVRSYLCGDEFNSLLAEDDSDALLQQLSSDLVIPCDSVLAIQDSASLEHFGKEDESVSVRSSEATVNQPLHEENLRPLYNSQSEAIPKKHHTNIPIEQDDAAAVTIQTAFRSYLAIRLSKQVEEKFVKEEGFSPGKLSMGTSLQVQTIYYVKTPFYRRKQSSPNQRTQHKNKTQVLRLKEDWDDSTVSSTISRLRIESRMEAMTKRERALAYAFSQKLRICSKKKQIDQSSNDESNIGWSWLERWMATRVPESISIEPRTNSETNVATRNQRLVVIKNTPFGVTGELESCASNDIPLQFESISETVEKETEDFQSSLRAEGISKRKSAPSYKTHTRHGRIQATKRDLQQQTKKAKKAKTTPSSCKKGK